MSNVINSKNQNEFRRDLIEAYRQDETLCVNHLLDAVAFSPESDQKIKVLATDLVNAVRHQTSQISGVEALMRHYDLSTTEGIMLLCIAESLLRIPDAETEKLLIQDKLTSARWEEHLGKSESAFVNVTTWGLALTGKVLENHRYENQFKTIWYDLLRRSSQPLIRQAIHEAVKIMAHQFVIGRNMDQALQASKEMTKKGYMYSYDMLGEVARTKADADRYFQAYLQAIRNLGQHSPSGIQTISSRPSISVKLSALYPRYEPKQREKAVPFLVERLLELAHEALQASIGLTLDAEEADRLDMSLDIFKHVFKHNQISPLGRLRPCSSRLSKTRFAIDSLAN